MDDAQETGRWLLTVTGPDRPGIIAAISDIFARADADIEDVSMTRLSGNFAMILLARGGDETELRRELGRVSESLEMMVHLRRAARTVRDETPNFFVSAAGPNRIGIVSRLSALLAGHGVNITEMSTRLLGRTRIPVYLVRIECFAEPAQVELLQKTLADAGAELGVEVRAELLESTDL